MGEIYSAKDFGREIRQARKRNGLTQSGLSEFTGFSVSFISDLERGKPTAELEKAVYLLNMLGCDLEIRPRGQS